MEGNFILKFWQLQKIQGQMISVFFVRKKKKIVPQIHVQVVSPEFQILKEEINGLQFVHMIERTTTLVNFQQN